MFVLSSGRDICLRQEWRATDEAGCLSMPVTCMS